MVGGPPSGYRVDMEHTTTLVTNDPDEAREFILDAERSGIDGSELRVTSQSPVDSDAMSVADSRFMKRTAKRVVTGMALGAAAAVAVALVLAIAGAAEAWLILTSSIALVMGGALMRLYGGMSASGATAEADMPGPTVVELTDSPTRIAL